jgi:hypothetical protein
VHVCAFLFFEFTDVNYQLVLICTTENEHSARIAAVMEKHVCSFRQPETGEVAKYLSDKLTACDDLQRLIAPSR